MRNPAQRAFRRAQLLRRLGWPFKRVDEEIQYDKDGMVIFGCVSKFGPMSVREALTWAWMKLRLWPIQRRINRSWGVRSRVRARTGLSGWLRPLK